MGTGSFYSSDLFNVLNVTQNMQILASKELIISKLREYYAKDSKYHYSKDPYGFPNTPDHTDLPPDAGENNDATTRIYIGQESRLDIPFYPAVLVKHGGSSYVPISFNQEAECIVKDFRLFIDGYGNKYNIEIPTHFIFAGAWDISLSIEIMTEGPQDRSTIAEGISILLQSALRNELTKAGLFIKNLKTDGESTENYQNDLIYKQNISLDCRGEYRRLIPVENVLEVINVCIDVGNVDTQMYDPNLAIHFNFDESDIVWNASPVKQT